MFKTETNLKCKGCKKNLPEKGYDVRIQKSTWFGKYDLSLLIEWICLTCWEKGERYSK